MEAARDVLAAQDRRVQPAMTAVNTQQGGEARFLSVAAVARIFGVSDLTVYREIRSGRFPAIKWRGRYVIPARAIAAMEAAAIDGGRLVDASEWVSVSEQSADSEIDLDRPRPGANQTGAGSPITQQGAREAISMTDPGQAASRTPRSDNETNGGVA